MMIVYKLVDRSGEPYEENIVNWFCYRARAQRALRELPARERTDTMLDGTARFVIREHPINDEAE